MSQFNARLIEKDILDGLVTSAEPGSVAIDLFKYGGPSKFSCQAIYDVSTPAAKTFDSGKQATLTNQSVTYLANDRGTAGNSITVALLNTGVASQALQISVASTAISVNLALDAGVHASRIIQDLTYTAAAIGTGGNSITLTYLDDTPGGPVSVGVSGNAITVHMDATPVTGSTATAIAAAINLSAPALLLVSVAISGTGATVQTAQSSTPLQNGAAPAITTTASQLVTALLLDSGVTDLITPSGSGASPLIAYSVHPLLTGADSEVDVDEDTVSIPSHGYVTGFAVQLTTTGTLPDGLSTGTDYYVIKVDANTIQFAASEQDAEDGVAIDLIDEGSNGAVNTVTGDALSNASVTFQKSNDGVNWINIQSATSITVDGSVLLEQPNVSYRYFQVVKDLDAGVFDLKALVLVVGDAI